MSPGELRVTLPLLPEAPLALICPAVIWFLASRVMVPPLVAPDEFRLLVVILCLLLVRVRLPPFPEVSVEEEFRAEVKMLSAAVRAIAPPSPDLELELRSARAVIVPLLLSNVILPPLPLPAVLEFTAPVLMSPSAERAIAPPSPN